MKKAFLKAGILCLFASLCLSAYGATATFQVMADPVNGTWANFALSGDGTVMAANYGGEIYRWTAATGFQDQGPGDIFASSLGISQDGSTIISGHIGLDGFASPALWTTSGVTDLGHPSNGCTPLANSWGSGYGVNRNGKVAVALAWTCNAAEGFVWTSQRGNLSLGHPPGNHSSRASAISADGKTIVGFWEDPTGPRRPVRWHGGTRDLFLGDATLGEATALNSDGSQIVGQTPGATGNGVAFLYSDNAGLNLLGTISHSPNDQSVANAISDNGRVIGWSGDPFGKGIKAFLWTPQMGMKDLLTVLNRMGANIPAGTTLTTALSISADGTTMVGQYVDQVKVGNWMVHIQ